MLPRGPSSRPLPNPPSILASKEYHDHAYSSPFELDYSKNPYLPSPYAADATLAHVDYEPHNALPGGTLLHKGFYDLLSMIPTPSPSRMLWRPVGSPAVDENLLVAGPRYEALPAPTSPTSKHAASPPSSPPTSPMPKRGRRISKDMIAKPTGFIHLVHASDADQLEALLTRWGPDGMGKLGDPRWAQPIKERIRANHQEAAINQVVNALKPSQSGLTERAPLRVINGLSTATSSIITNAAGENVPVSPVTPSLMDGFPSRLADSTIRWGGGLPVHQELRELEGEEGEGTSLTAEQQVPQMQLEPQRKPITPSLATLEKAVAARIYFENLYFPLLRQPPSREQRRLAMEKDMMEMRLTEGQKEQLRARWRQNETDYLREKRRKIDVTAFVKLKTIGHGAFGVVSLVKERSTGQLYAMKELRKTDMLRKGQEGHVRAERDILKSASLVNSPNGADWIVRLIYSFQDRDHLYLVLEYMGGGDLLNLLIERDVFEEDFTRFYVAEMILAIETCHKHGFIHRDIKPDNFLFDPNGHIKLSDFGLATDLHWAHDTSYYEQQRIHLLHKHGIDLEDPNGLADGTKTKRMKRRDIESIMGGGDSSGGIFTWREKNKRKLAYSVCGTNSYMSPEVIRGQGYSYSCDWWSLGVIMYECLYGFPPFVSNSRHVTRQKILNWKQSLQFPSRPRVSQEGINLIQQLLCEPEDRLGSQASSSISRPNSIRVQARKSGFMAASPFSVDDGATLIKTHPWFRGIDWKNIHRYPAPYQPELRTPGDTRHFDPDIPAEPLAPANGAPPDATKDPLLRDKIHGAQVLDVRKALAFAGFTHKSPRAISYVRADRAFDAEPDSYGREPVEAERTRGRATVRGPRDMGRGRALSM